MNSNSFKIDSEHKTLWDLTNGIVYAIVNENEWFYKIERDSQLGIFSKEKQEIIIPVNYDSIGNSGYNPFSNFGIIPSESFEIRKDGYIGIASTKDGVLLEPLIDPLEFEVYPNTFSEDIVVVQKLSDNIPEKLTPVLRFLDTRNGNLSCVFTDIRSKFHNGRAAATYQRRILEFNSDLEITDSYDAVFYGFNDEAYYQ